MACSYFENPSLNMEMSCCKKKMQYMFIFCIAALVLNCTSPVQACTEIRNGTNISLGCIYHTNLSGGVDLYENTSGVPVKLNKDRASASYRTYTLMQPYLVIFNSSTQVKMFYCDKIRYDPLRRSVGHYNLTCLVLKQDLPQEVATSTTHSMSNDTGTKPVPGSDPGDEEEEKRSFSIRTIMIVFGVLVCAALSIAILYCYLRKRGIDVVGDGRERGGENGNPPPPVGLTGPLSNSLVNTQVFYNVCRQQDPSGTRGSQPNRGRQTADSQVSTSTQGNGLEYVCDMRLVSEPVKCTEVETDSYSRNFTTVQVKPYTCTVLRSDTCMTFSLVGPVTGSLDGIVCTDKHAHLSQECTESSQHSINTLHVYSAPEEDSCCRTEQQKSMSEFESFEMATSSDDETYTTVLPVRAEGTRNSLRRRINRRETLPESVQYVDSFNRKSFSYFIASPQSCIVEEESSIVEDSGGINSHLCYPWREQDSIHGFKRTEIICDPPGQSIHTREEYSSDVDTRTISLPEKDLCTGFVPLPFVWPCPSPDEHDLVVIDENLRYDFNPGELEERGENESIPKATVLVPIDHSQQGECCVTDKQVSVNCQQPNDRKYFVHIPRTLAANTKCQDPNYRPLFHPEHCTSLSELLNLLSHVIGQCAKTDYRSHVSNHPPEINSGSPPIEPSSQVTRSPVSNHPPEIYSDSPSKEPLSTSNISTLVVSLLAVCCFVELFMNSVESVERSKKSDFLVDITMMMTVTYYSCVNPFLLNQPIAG